MGDQQRLELALSAEQQALDITEKLRTQVRGVGVGCPVSRLVLPGATYQLLGEREGGRQHKDRI